jgi:hypothetical protein
MGIEFDPSTSTYYQTAYTGSVTTRGEATEMPPSEADAVETSQMQASAYPEDVPPTTTVSDPAADAAAGKEPPPDSLSDTPEPFAPNQPVVGSLVDTVV